MLMHNRVYVPTLHQLNDPLEVYGVVHSGSYAGCSFSIAVEQQGKGLNQTKGYRVLSLTELSASLQMWAYYGDGYKGVCIQFGAGRLPFELVPVHYAERPVQLRGEIADSIYDCESISTAALSSKHIDWAYEQEWREILDEAEVDDEGYIGVGSKNLTAVIIGDVCANPTASFIHEACRNRNIPVCRTYLATWTQRVRLLPDLMKIQRDGTSLRNQVEAYCRDRGMTDLNNW